MKVPTNHSLRVDIKKLISQNRKLLAERWKVTGRDPKKFQSGNIAPPPPEGFIRGYHLLKVEHGISDIKQNWLKVSRFSDLNDPFELVALNFHQQSIRHAGQEHKKAQNAELGVLCFSTNWKSPLLWSHYAEKHRGLCLGFDLRSSSVEEVKYADKRIRAELDMQDGDALKIPPDVQKLLRVTKARCWDYEEEIRLFVSLKNAKLKGNLFFWPFHHDFRLVEVIIGPECTKSVRSIEALSDNNVYVSKARLAWRSFTVVPKGTHLSSKLQAPLA